MGQSRKVHQALVVSLEHGVRLLHDFDFKVGVQHVRNARKPAVVLDSGRYLERYVIRQGRSSDVHRLGDTRIYLF